VVAARVSLSAVSAAGRAALRTLIDLAGPSRPVWLVGGAVRQRNTQFQNIPGFMSASPR